MGAPAPALGRALAALLLVLVAGCGGGRGGATTTTTATTPAAPRLTPAPASDCVEGFTCGTLRVPQDPGDARRSLDLRVVAQQGARDDRVLLVLSGGPGQPGSDLAVRVAQLLDLDHVRVVGLDQRGTGGGALLCPALQDAVGSSDIAAPPPAATRACAQRLGAAADDYATTDTVADLEALRRALGAPRLDLLGVSYGTYVAQRYALAHPATTGRLVLDSVVPQEGADALERVPLQATAGVLRDVCGACAAQLRELVTRRPELALGLFEALTTQSVVDARFPGWDPALRAATGGDLGPVRRLIAQAERRRTAPADFLSSGLHAAALCADGPAPWPLTDAPPARARALRDAVRDLPAGATGLWPRSLAAEQGLAATCVQWPATGAAPRTDGVIRAPVLLVNGTRDLSTPLAWAREQAGRMPAAELVEVAGAGHSVLGRDAGATAAVRRFLRGG